MKKKLGPVEKYKPLWEGGKSVEQYNIKVGFKIRMFCVQELNTSRQKNPNAFGPKETEDLTKMIMDLKQDKGTISQEDQNCSLEDYQQFLQEFFQRVDYEDRHGTVTVKTSSKFRLMAAFIDVLKSWGSIDEEMIKCKKYCQFKAVDIFKALKNGQVPKRGGPKEQENQDAGLGNEIDELAQNMGDANLGNNNNNNFNQNQGGNQQQFGNNNQFSNPYGNQQFHQQGNNNQYGIPNNNMNNAGFSNPFGNQNNFNNNNMNKNSISNSNRGMPQQPQYQPQQYQKQYHQTQQPQQNRYNHNQQQNYQNQQYQGGMNKARKSKVFPSNDKDPQKRMFKGKYELNCKIPVKYNSVDYFMLVENVRINNEAALRELKRGKASDILNMVLDSLEFLSYIHK
jgi:hypothetical protein